MGIKSNFITAGSIEIKKYLSPTLLDKDVEEMDIDEFIEALAKARYVKELEENLMARAISKVFGDKK